MKLVDPSLPWFVIWTAPSQEDRAERSLREAGYPVYVPRMRKEIIHHRYYTKVEKTYVLFNRYLFVAVPTGDFYAARNCDGVQCFLGVDGVPCRISGHGIVALQTDEMNGVFNKFLPVKAPKPKPIRARSFEELKALLDSFSPAEFDASEVERAA